MLDITFNVVLSKEAEESMSKPWNISIWSTMKECRDNAETPFSVIIKVEKDNYYWANVYWKKEIVLYEWKWKYTICWSEEWIDKDDVEILSKIPVT